jgi:hypothetical protein
VHEVLLLASAREEVLANPCLHLRLELFQEVQYSLKDGLLGS